MGKCLAVEGFEGRLEAALWDAHDSCWFLLYAGHTIVSYFYSPNSISGAGSNLPDSPCLYPEEILRVLHEIISHVD